MSKVSGKNSIILIGGHNYSTYATAYDGMNDNGMIDVTGFTDGGQNFIPGLPSATMNINMLWDSTATVGTHAVLSAFPQAHVTLIPDGYAVGNQSLSMPFVQGNYMPQGNPAGAIELGQLNFMGRGENVGLEQGWALQHATITDTATSTPVDDPSGGAVTAACSGTIHIWTACAS